MRQRILGPDDSRAPSRRTRHGLTANEIDYLSQGGCAICHRTDRDLQVDHDHRHCPGPTGCRQCARGMVCHRCNEAIKFVDDSPARAEALRDYLIRTAPR